jgi:hypothetical protein
MSIWSSFTRRFWYRTPIGPDPNKDYEFIFVAKFPDQQTANLFASSVNRLNLEPRFRELPNGRCNAEYSLVARPNSPQLAAARAALTEAAARYGESSPMFLGGAPKDRSNAQS